MREEEGRNNGKKRREETNTEHHISEEADTENFRSVHGKCVSVNVLGY